MLALCEEMAGNAVRQATTVMDALPNGFPEHLVASVMAAMAHRVGFLEKLQ